MKKNDPHIFFMSRKAALLAPLLFNIRHRLFPSGRLSIPVLSIILGGLLLCIGIYHISLKTVGYFNSQSEIGILLSLKIFQMGWVIIFSMLVFSCMVSSVSNIFLSQDNEILFCAPVSPGELYFARFIATSFQTSWMMLAFATPVFASFGTVFKAGTEYIPLLVLSLFCTALIANGTGTALTILLVRVFPARRTKDIVFYLSLCFGIFLYIIFRMLRPEDLVNPENYAHFVEYFSAVSRPTGVWLPASWASDILTASLQERDIDWLKFFLLLLTPFTIFFIGEWLAQSLFFKAFTRSQESFGGYRNFSSKISYIPSVTRWLFRKERTAFFRDSAEWSQLFMIAALAIVYLYSFHALPIERSPFKTDYIANLISFLNTGMIGFIITSLAMRFVFPSVGAEGGGIYLIKSSPISLKFFLRNRTFFYLPPFVVFSILLAVVSDYLLQIKGPMWWFSLLSTIAICWTVLNLAVSFGVIYADFKAESRAAVQGSLGAVFFLFTAMSYVVVVIVTGAWPAFRLVRRWFVTGQYDPFYTACSAGWFIAVISSGIIINYIFRQKALKSLQG